jgi:hypothetical protein
MQGQEKMLPTPTHFAYYHVTEGRIPAGKRTRKERPMRSLKRWWLPLLAAGVCVWALGAGLWASATNQDGGPPPFNKAVQEGLQKVLRTGVHLYNNERDYAGCYRVYRGSLLTLRPLLVQYPDLQQAIDTGFARADGLPRMWQRAHALRDVIDTIYRRMGTAAPAPEPEKKAEPKEPEKKEEEKKETEKKEEEKKEAEKKEPEKKDDEKEMKKDDEEKVEKKKGSAKKEIEKKDDQEKAEKKEPAKKDDEEKGEEQKKGEKKKDDDAQASARERLDRCLGRWEANAVLTPADDAWHRRGLPPRRWRA